MIQLLKEMLVAFGQVLMACVIVIIIVGCVALGLFGAAKALQKAITKLSQTYKANKNGY